MSQIAFTKKEAASRYKVNSDELDILILDVLQVDPDEINTLSEGQLQQLDDHFMGYVKQKNILKESKLVEQQKPEETAVTTTSNDALTSAHQAHQAMRDGQFETLAMLEAQAGKAEGWVLAVVNELARINSYNEAQQRFLQGHLQDMMAHLQNRNGMDLNDFLQQQGIALPQDTLSKAQSLNSEQQKINALVGEIQAKATATSWMN